jgi:hypothetical protein
MRLSALIFYIGGACALTAACGPISTQAPVATQPAPAATCDHTSSGGNFVSAKVFKLSANFHPDMGAAPTTMDIIGPVTQADTYYNTLTSAFEAAPPFFKDKLCGLASVYIVQNTCNGTCTAADLINNSWGLRAYRSTGYPESIATSVQLLLDPTLKLSVFETQRLMYLLHFVSAGADAWTHHPAYQVAPVTFDTLVFSVLAAFAHEYGHVLWYDSFVSQPGQNIDGLDTFCRGKNKYGRFYPPGQWDKISLPNNRWINFANKQDRYHIDHFTSLQNALDAGGITGRFYPKADKELYKGLADDSVTDLLSVFSSTEDFVTAYELNVLKQAQLTTLNVEMYDDSGTIDPNYEVNFFGKLGSNTDLYEKVKCF